MAIAVSAPANAAERTIPIGTRGGSLSSALHDIARQSGAELLFGEESVRGISAAPVRGRFTVETALRRLLAGTGLSVRRASSGAYIIERAAAGAALAPQAAALAALPEPAVPEILVIGRRTHNADIRRRENDVQPYRVTGRREIVQAHRETLDHFFQSRITANTQALSPSLLDEGKTLSEIDLRGLGSDATLLLVDGRRLPSIPGWIEGPLIVGRPGFGFRQPDINAIPLHAIDRVETLTGTAGGIYGFGALGGVVNVVLRRDYRGIELHGSTNIASRGDAKRLRLEGRLGFTPDDGRTDVMLYLSHSGAEPLRVGDRDYAVRDAKQRYRFYPDFYLTLQGFEANSVAVKTLFADDTLSFKPQYGGGALGAGYTFLPAGFGGSRAKLVEALTERAGELDFTLSEGQAESGLGSTPTMTTAIANVRHRFGGGIEGYFDALVMRNSGRAFGLYRLGFDVRLRRFADQPVQRAHTAEIPGSRRGRPPPPNLHHLPLYGRDGRRPPDQGVAGDGRDDVRLDPRAPATGDDRHSRQPDRAAVRTRHQPARKLGRVPARDRVRYRVVGEGGAGAESLPGNIRPSGGAAGRGWRRSGHADAAGGTAERARARFHDVQPPAVGSRLDGD
jgi:outer membrane receptor protein involved in Fe transport